MLSKYNEKVACMVTVRKLAAIAQLVEQGTENPCVLGSIPSCGTILKDNNSEGFNPRLFFVKFEN